MLQLTTARGITWDGVTYAHGDVLPESIHAWPLLHTEMERGAITVAADNPHVELVSAGGLTLDGTVPADGEGHPAIAAMPAERLAGLLRRGQLKCTNMPTPLATALCAAAARGRLTLEVRSPAAPPSAEPIPAPDASAPQPQTDEADAILPDAPRAPRPEDFAKRQERKPRRPQ